MSSRQRTRSRSCSRSTDGIVTSVNSPAASNRARPDRVALIGLDPVLRRTLGLARCAHPELDPLRPRPAREPVPGRARLIDHPRRPLHTPQPRQQLVRAADHPLRGHLARGLVKDRERRLARVHVQTDPTDTVRHRRSSRRLWARAEGAILSAKTYPAACAGSADPFDTPKAGPPYRLNAIAGGKTFKGQSNHQRFAECDKRRRARSGNLAGGLQRLGLSDQLSSSEGLGRQGLLKYGLEMAARLRQTQQVVIGARWG